jgi:cytoskeletal protein CcmA (bactofilin family)
MVVMRDEKGHLVGDAIIAEPLVLWGSITGNVVAVEGSKFYLRGVIYGDLDVQSGGRVHIFGSVSGNVTVQDRAKLIVSGVVAGNAINCGGRLYIESAARVLGKVKTESGETKVERPAPGDSSTT